ncbi:MAG: multicopper oxidase family protein, partial [Alphaproteobacteria bacterium]
MVSELPGLTRRDALIATGIAAGATVALTRRARAAEPAVLRVERRSTDIAGRAATVLGFASLPRGGVIRIGRGERFRAVLANHLDEPTLIHWHGQTPPTDQDGVPDLSQPALAPGGQYVYDFPARPGTHWLHSHVGLQEQELLAAPMIVEDPIEPDGDEQEIVVFVQDFTFRAPEEILAELRAGGGAHAAHGMAGLNDVEHDAYLTNGRTLDDPEVVTVERGGRVRLRVINASAATNVWLDLGRLAGAAVATDGNAVVPVAGSRFPLAIAQRLDIRIAVPGETGSWPVLALREGGRERGGLVLATAGATVARVDAMGDGMAPAVDLSLERNLAAVAGLQSRPADRTLDVVLTGGGADYVWSLDDRVFGRHEPIGVRSGERVAVTFRNTTRMAHPM